MAAARVDPRGLRWTPYLTGKSELFLSRIDCELEVDGIVFPIHSAIVTNASSMLDKFLESFISTSGADAGAGLQRVVLKRKRPPPATPLLAAADGVPEGSESQRRRSRMVQRGAAPVQQGAAAANATPAAEAEAGAPAAAALPAAAPGESVLSPERVRLFLVHVYDSDKRVTKEEDAISLLELSDFFQAKSMRLACDRALVEIAKSKMTHHGPPINLMELAAKYKLRHLMAHSMASVLVWIGQGRSGMHSAVLMPSAKPYLDLLDGDLKNEVIMELAQRRSVGPNDAAQLAEHFMYGIDRLGWDK